MGNCSRRLHSGIDRAAISVVGPRKERHEEGFATVITFRISLKALQVAAGLCVLAPAAHGQTPAAIARGQEIAERACGGCHAIAGWPGSTVQGTAAPSFG